MWDGLLLLLFLSALMGGASFAAGALPLSFTLTPRQLRLLTALGTGVLVGTSLIVIIPEGVEAVYAASGSSHGHSKRGIERRIETASKLESRAWTASWDSKRDAEAAALPQMLSTSQSLQPRDESHIDLDDLDSPSESPTHDEDNDNNPDDHTPDNDFHQGTPSSHDPHVWIGSTLILGFILMYLIDTIPQSAFASAQPKRLHISLNQFSFNNRATTSQSPIQTTTNNHLHSSTSNPYPPNSNPSTLTTLSMLSQFTPNPTTLGLLIHATADGIALGASSTSNSSSSRNLSFIIFLALMLHKAPAAFGLTTVLLKQGLSKRQARANLVVFSLAAPLGAVATWVLVRVFGWGGSGAGEGGTEFATGVLLLFSGGTFLYVAMHTMRETTGQGHGHGDGLGGGNGYVGVGNGEDDGFGMGSVSGGDGAGRRDLVEELTETGTTVVGMLLPLLTQWGHV